MNTLQKQFARMGARLKVCNVNSMTPFTLDISRDGDGEFFDMALVKGEEIDFQVVDVQKKDRHLILSASLSNPADHTRPFTSKFLCGHDERHWFVAGVNPSATSVEKAKQSLKPVEVVESQKRRGVRKKNRHKRKNKGFIRQGEWFFIPEPSLDTQRHIILKKEPLQRGAGKPHIAEELYRRGGEAVRVHRRHAPNGITEVEFARLTKEVQEEPGWRNMVRNPEAFVRGKIRHPDHKTIVLKEWHKVVANREVGSRNVAFLD